MTSPVTELTRISIPAVSGDPLGMNPPSDVWNIILDILVDQAIQEHTCDKVRCMHKLGTQGPVVTPPLSDALKCVSLVNHYLNKAVNRKLFGVVFLSGQSSFDKIYNSLRQETFSHIG